MPKIPSDPSNWRKVPRYSPSRLLLWTLPNRIQKVYARVTYKKIGELVDGDIVHRRTDRGLTLPNTALTTRQCELLLEALTATTHLGRPLIEVGCFWGTTTSLLARNTKQIIYGVDPFTGGGGSEEDYVRFQETIKPLGNVVHLRLTSGAAFLQMRNSVFSLIFIDAVHDYPNTWFDFCVWSTVTAVGGMIALHDVDDWPGTNMACRRIMAQSRDVKLWGYCPNLAIFRRI